LTASEYVDDGYAFLATQNLRGDNLDFENVNYITSFRYEESPELKLQVGDVLVSKDGTLGVTAVVKHLPRPATVNGSIAVIRPRDMDSRFLRYQLDSSVVQGLIRAYKSGMGVPHLFQADLKKFPLSCPPLHVQRAIANYLDAETTRIDALITKRQRMIELWRERLASNIDSLVWGSDGSEMYMPRPGWEYPAFSVVVMISEGQVDPRTEPYRDLPLIAPNHIESGTGRLLTLETASEQGAISGKYLCAPGDVIYSKIRPALCKATITNEICLTSADMYPMRPNSSVLPSYLLYYLLSRRFTDFAILESERVAMPKINRDALGRVRLPIPPMHVQEDVVRALDRKSESVRMILLVLARQVAVLEERRQALITAAVTGQLDIPEVVHGNH
jgi:type I restriction enzyme S subunit